MSFVMRLPHLAKVCTGKLINSQLIAQKSDFNTLCTDTRKVKSGDVFLALSGENFDGHDFCQQAVEAGAIAIIVERELPIEVPQLIVKSSHIALGLIAKDNRGKYKGSLIALTGSNGKTTTKEIIASILKVKGITLATKGNLNNEIGVPLTLLDFDGKQQYSVVEMGANAKGEIAYCTHLAQPDVALINNAMGAHLEGFGSLQGVVEAKGEIFQGLNNNGTAILNLDDANVGQWIELCADKKQLTFSLKNTDADVYATNIEQLIAGNYRFTLNYQNKSANVTLQLLAIHNVKNALAAAACVFAIGGTLAQIVEGLENAKAMAGRLKQLEGINNAVVIDDSYNGNPDSVKAGLDLLSELKGCKVLALGDMAELGEQELQLHRSVGEYAAAKNIDYLYSCGPKGQLAADEFSLLTGKPSMAFDDQQNMINSLVNMMKDDVKVLVKGSLSSGMKKVVTALTCLALNQGSNK